MADLNLIEAVRDALRVEMRRDPRVVVLGEDVGRFGGVFRATDGLQEEFGPERCIDTPLAESGIVGTAIGMALYGMRPVPEIQFGDYIYPAFDQIVNELAKLRYRSGGEYSAPVVIRTPVGGGIKGGHYHSQSPEAFFTPRPGHQGGLPVEPLRRQGAPGERDPRRGSGRLHGAEAASTASHAREVPEGEYTIPLGEAKVVREGKQVTVIAWSAMVTTAARGSRERGGAGVRPRGDRPAHAGPVRRSDRSWRRSRRPVGW